MRYLFRCSAVGFGTGAGFSVDGWSWIPKIYIGDLDFYDNTMTICDFNFTVRMHACSSTIHLLYSYSILAFFCVRMWARIMINGSAESLGRRDVAVDGRWRRCFKAARVGPSGSNIMPKRVATVDVGKSIRLSGSKEDNMTNYSSFSISCWGIRILEKPLMPPPSCRYFLGKLRRRGFNTARSNNSIQLIPLPLPTNHHSVLVEPMQINSGPVHQMVVSDQSSP